MNDILIFANSYKIFLSEVFSVNLVLLLEDVYFIVYIE
jgi:hypothetical protein